MLKVVLAADRGGAAAPLIELFALVDSGAWGPQFRLSPAFVDYDVALLGRADFFQAFTVTFQEDLRAPVFHLDH